MYNERKWVIVTFKQISQADERDPDTGEIIGNALIDSAIEHRSALRPSLDGQKTILKWDGETPAAFAGMTTYNYNEIRTILAGADWKATVP